MLGVPLHAVPHFLANGPEPGWWDRMQAWLTEHHGFALMGWTAGGWDVPPVLHLTQGRTAGGAAHVVVAFGGRLLHDPHPSNAGLSEPLTHELFLIVRPRALATVTRSPDAGAQDVEVQCATSGVASEHPPWIPGRPLRRVEAGDGVKRCTKCGLVKEVTGFPKERTRRSSWCRPCRYATRTTINVRTRLAVLSHYSHGTMRCACCGQHRLPFLALDHIHNDGADQRKTIGASPGSGFFRWLVTNGFPPGLQVLCHNCNIAKAAYGSCPHTRKPPSVGLPRPDAAAGG